MNIPQTDAETNAWSTCLRRAQESKLAAFTFGINVLRRYDEGNLDITDVRGLMLTSSDAAKPPSEPTAYRFLAKWREIAYTLDNPANGA